MSQPTAGGRCEVELTDEALQDVKDLSPQDGSGEAKAARERLAIAVVRAAREIEEHPWVGEPLRDDGQIKGIGELRKVRFDPDSKMPPSLRLVYLLTPPGEHPTKAQVVAIGKRHRMVVYRIAGRRMKER